MFFISPFSFHLSVFRFTKERLNTSIDTSKMNNNIKNSPRKSNDLRGEKDFNIASLYSVWRLLHIDQYLVQD